MQNDPRVTVQSIDRAVAILNVFLDGAAELSLSEIARRTRLTRSTTHRLLASLAAHGLVEQRAAGSRYSLGPHLLRLAEAVAGGADLVARARPIMNALRDDLEETVGLHVRQGHRFRVVVAQAESRLQLRRTYTEVGEPIPIHLGASGKVLLAWLPADLQDAVLSQPLEAATERTITEPAALRRELEQIRRSGYAVSLQERNAAVSAIAAPVRGRSGEVVAALGVTGPSVRLPKKRLVGMYPALRAAAQGLSRDLGAVVDESARR
jgi:IclR family transcriptional regulator, acetate operon repressor